MIKISFPGLVKTIKTTANQIAATTINSIRASDIDYLKGVTGNIQSQLTALDQKKKS